ncbi:MAG: polyprenol monophosphomannose synthase [Acidimicrobiales bacterium]
MTNPTALVVLPTYNEVDNIRCCLEAIITVHPSVEVLVVDDSSPDGTAAVAHEVAGEHPGRVHVLSRDVKDGLGAAYRAGFSWALDAGYQVIAQMDADGSHPAECLPVMLDLVLSGAVDLAVGSRYIAGGGTANWPLRRRILSRAANFYARSVLHLSQRDVTGAFRVWTAPALRAVDPASMTATGYGFLFEMASAAQRCGLVVREVPITFVDRAYGTSKMNSSVALEGALLVWQLRKPAPPSAPTAVTLAGTKAVAA